MLLLHPRVQMNLFDVFLLLLVPGTAFSNRCKTPNGELALCIPIQDCKIFVDASVSDQLNAVEFIQKSRCGHVNGSMAMCCGSSISYTNETEEVSPVTPDRALEMKLEEVSSVTLELEKASSVIPDRMAKMRLLPRMDWCGYEYLKNGRLANASDSYVDEYPWLARLIHKTDDGTVSVACSATLINIRYVLTVAHCLSLNSSKLVAVRIGKCNAVKNKVCVNRKFFEKHCLDDEIEYAIEEIIQHPDYNLTSRQHDIGLIRLHRNVMLSDYIQPICLPFPDTKLAQFGDKLSASGRGRLIYTHQKKIFTELLPLQCCIDEYEQFEEIVITEYQTCTLDDEAVNGVNCNGDFGAPVMFPSNENQWHLEGIVSYGKGCATFTSPAVNVNVVKYLDWILENIKK